MDVVPEIAVSVPLRSELEGTREELSTKVLHKYICSIITMFGIFLPMKQRARNESLFNTDYPVMVSLIVALIAYGGSLIGSIIHVQTRPNSDLAESIINKISVLFRILVWILEVVILMPGVGLVALFLWVIWFVKVAAEYTCQYLETLYQSAVASVVHTCGKLKDYMNMIIRRFTTKPEGQTNELPQVSSTTV